MKHVTVGQEYLKNHDWLLMTFSVKGLNSKRGQFFQNMNPNIPCEFLNNLGGGGGGRAENFEHFHFEPFQTIQNTKFIFLFLL